MIDNVFLLQLLAVTVQCGTEMSGQYFSALQFSRLVLILKLPIVQGRCVICGGPGISDAYYCKECTVQEKDRDGCPKIVNLGSSKTDLFYEMKKYGFKKR